MLAVEILSHETEGKAAEVLAFLLFEEDNTLAGGISLPREKATQYLRLAREEGFKAKEEEVFSLYPEGGKPSKKMLLAGLGKKSEFNREKLLKAAGRCVRQSQKHNRSLRFVVPNIPKETLTTLIQTIAEGCHLASYRFNRHRKVTPEDTPRLEKVQISSKEKSPHASQILDKAKIIAEAVCSVRDLVNEPPSNKKPEDIAAMATLLKKEGIKVTIFDKAELSRMGMNALLGVSRGSAHPPCLVHLIYKPSKAKKKIGLVGKGITFDSGGLSLKPPEAMEDMKMDMAGAATVLAILRAAAKLKPNVELHGFMALSYNMPGDDAMKPGDIVKAHNGKTIEVLNTDAEGRLVLADALSYACRQKLDAVVDLATLTGAVLIALGSNVTGAMTNNTDFLKKITAVSEKTGEKIWELPLVPEYKEGLKSKFADLQNISSVRREAGTIIGGLFLQEFVEDIPWIHFDIAGTAWVNSANAICPPGGTGAMVRTLIEYLCSI
ncbi:MAG: leucyl aminopeptidase [Elusimicrobia bacterium]|nr:leucyl aminopeptidase [Elusimicrobiota bacterium]